MNAIKFTLTFVLGLSITGSALYAQSTFDNIHSIFQSSCVSYCHDAGALAGGLDLSGTPAEVYNRIIDREPVNNAAKEKGNKLIDPGHPHNSFLLKKINNGLDEDNDFAPADEGEAMPKGATALSNAEIDLIHQWILQGAPQFGYVVDEPLIQSFHSGNGMVRMKKPEPPDEGEGFQIHFGPIFLAPLEEKEFFKKHYINLPDSMEVYRLESFINFQSHHYIVYKFLDSTAASAAPTGIQLATVSSTDNDALVAGWQFSSDIELPEGTAYFWDPNTVLDLNYHILNYSQDSILKAEAYTNVYMRKKQDHTIEMHSDLVLYKDGFPSPFSDFLIPADAQDHTFTEAEYNAFSTDTMHIWLLASHTHKYGKDFDIYIREPGGTKGEQLYEGFYNVDYSINQGFYDWEHPAVRYFNPLKKVAEKDGLIQEAVFNNYGAQEVTFGLTTADEMMLYFIQYTLDTPAVPAGSTLVPETVELGTLAVFPNPFNRQFTLAFTLPAPAPVEVGLFNLLGEKVAAVRSPSTLRDGKHFLSFDAHQLPSGVYLLQLRVANKIHTRKLMRMD